jgi:hypothetical protein
MKRRVNQIFAVAILSISCANSYPVSITNRTEFEVEFAVVRESEALHSGRLAVGATHRMKIPVKEEAYLTITATVGTVELAVTNCYTTALGGACRFEIEHDRIVFLHDGQ